MTVTPVRYFHVDVFAPRPLGGNGLSVFLGCDGWSGGRMQRLTREMRQFESIFLSRLDDDSASARLFTVQEELDFAGHPLLGAAAVLHRLHGAGADPRSWTLRLAQRELRVTTQSRGSAAVFAEMDQGRATLGPPLDPTDCRELLAALCLQASDLTPGLPLQVVSTGLPYLIVPVVRDALARSAVRGRYLERLLAALGAKFVYVLDATTPEGRTWDNFGEVEDVATGSAAGPAAAYLFAHGLAAQPLLRLQRGRWTGRPSELLIRRDGGGRLQVSGLVWPVLSGVLDIAVTGADDRTDAE